MNRVVGNQANAREPQLRVEEIALGDQDLEETGHSALVPHGGEPQRIGDIARSTGSPHAVASTIDSRP